MYTISTRSDRSMPVRQQQDENEKTSNPGALSLFQEDDSPYLIMLCRKGFAYRRLETVVCESCGSICRNVSVGTDCSWFLNEEQSQRMPFSRHLIGVCDG